MTQTQQRDQAIERVRLELVTRKFMIMVLAMVGVWVGLAMMLTGAPSFIEDWFSPWSRYFIGGIAFGAGLTTTLGGLLGDGGRCGWWTQVAGLGLLGAWYASIGAAYVGLLYEQGGVPIVGPGEPLGAGITGRGYVPIVYAGLTIMTLTPLVTMFRLQRPDVMGPQDH